MPTYLLEIRIKDSDYEKRFEKKILDIVERDFFTGYLGLKGVESIKRNKLEYSKSNNGHYHFYTQLKDKEIKKRLEKILNLNDARSEYKLFNLNNPRDMLFFA
jgi:hypothetical protein